MNSNESNQATTVNFDVGRIARNIFIFCIVFELFLVFIDLFVNYGQLTDIGALRRLCNIAREDSLASWFSSAQTLMVSLTLFLISFFSFKSMSPRWINFGWTFLAIFFLYLAIDDGAEIHERLGTTFTILSNNSTTNDSFLHPVFFQLIKYFPSYTWQLIFVPLIAVSGIFILIFLVVQFRHLTLKYLILLAFICLATAVSLDFVEGLAENHRWNFQTFIRNQLIVDKYTVSHLSKSFEEFLEMVGFTFFWVSFVSYLKFLNHRSKYLLDFSDKKQT